MMFSHRQNQLIVAIRFFLSATFFSVCLRQTLRSFRFDCNFQAVVRIAGGFRRKRGHDMGVYRNRFVGADVASPAAARGSLHSNYIFGGNGSQLSQRHGLRLFWFPAFSQPVFFWTPFVIIGRHVLRTLLFVSQTENRTRNESRLYHSG